MTKKRTNSGSASVELGLLLPLVLIPVFIIGFDIAQALHARNTITNALHSAILSGYNEFSSLSDPWLKDLNGVIVDPQVKTAFDATFAANKHNYNITVNTTYLCQCAPPAPALPSTLGACNTPNVIACQEDYIRIYLSSSATMQFKTVIDWPGLPSSFPIGPIKAVIQIK